MTIKKYAVTIRYNPAGINSKVEDYAKILLDLGVTNVRYETTAGIHVHGIMLHDAHLRFPRKKGYRIFLVPLRDPEGWEDYITKEDRPDQADPQFPKFDIRKLSSGSSCCAEHRPDVHTVLNELYENAPYPY